MSEEIRLRKDSTLKGLFYKSIYVEPLNEYVKDVEDSCSVGEGRVFRDLERIYSRLWETWVEFEF